MLLIRKLAEIMEEMVYVRKTKDDEPFLASNDLGDVDSILKGFRLLYWPNDPWRDDKAAFWLEHGKGYNWERVMDVKCKAFESYESMACMIISAVNFCEKIGS